MLNMAARKIRLRFIKNPGVFLQPVLPIRQDKGLKGLSLRGQNSGSRAGFRKRFGNDFIPSGNYAITGSRHSSRERPVSA
jgi:hypothetical protein